VGAVIAQGRARSVAVGVSGLVATASAAAGLWGTVFPSGGTQKLAAPIAGSIRERDLETQVTLGKFLKENGMPAGKMTSDQRELRGAEVLLQVQLSGLAGPPSLFWTLYRYRRVPLGGPFDHQQGGVVPTLSGAFKGIAKVWLPLPSRTGVYLARIELVYKRATLDFVYTRRIGVRSMFIPPLTDKDPRYGPASPEPAPVPIPHVAAVFTPAAAVPR
jgi:hypothetical protein